MFQLMQSKKVKRKHSKWEKMFAKHVSDKELVCVMYREFIWLENKKT